MAYRKAKIEASKKQSEPQEPKTFNVSDKDEIERERALERMLLKEKCAGLFKNAKETRRRYDWEWLTRDLYRRGYQFSRYNPSNRTVVLASRGTVKIPINLVWAQMRVIKNQVTNFQPKWEVLPAGKSEQSKANARYSGKLLDYYYRRLGLRRLIKEVVIQGLTYSVGGPWQIGHDPNADNGLGEVYIWGLDPYDFYLDLYAPSPEEATFQTKAVRKPLDEVMSNSEYKFPATDIKGDLKLAESEYKQFLLQALKNQNFYSPETTEGVILKEFWLKRFVTEKNMEKIKLELEESEQDGKNLRSGETVMQVVTYLDSVIEPLKVQTLRRSDFPFVLYMADLNPREIYGESWLKHVIPMNRVLNGLESSVFQYNYKYAKGRIVMDKNSGVRMVSNQHGDFIEKNRGAEVTSLPLQPLPTSYQTQIENMRRYIEDIGGAHDVSLGRLPTGVKSGVGIAELKQADSTNQSDLVDALEDFLIQVGEKLLKEIAENYEVPKIVKDLGLGGKVEHFAVVGEKAGARRRDRREVRIGADVFPLAVIGKQNEIRVTVGSWLAYTKSAQQDKLKELYKDGLIDQKTALEHLEFSDVENIIEQTRQEELLKKFRGNPAAGQSQVSDEEIAEQENLMMVNEGREVPVEPTDNHAVHQAIHQEYAENPLVDRHLREHEALAATPASRMAPVGAPAPAPMVAAGEMPPQMAPMGSPAGVMEPSSPEEAALQNSLQDIITTGGQNA